MNPRELGELQRLVARAALVPRPLEEEPAIVDDAVRAIRESARMTSVAQLDVYREQFWARHVHSLEDDFAIARHFLGEQAFFDLVAAYFASRPPSSFDLRGLGASLPAFAGSRAPFAEDAMLREAMTLDWAFMEAFDAPSAPPFDPASIAGAPEDAWPGATLAFDPSVRALALSWPLHETRAAIRRKESPPRPEARASFVVIFRGRDSLHHTEIEREAFALLTRLRDGAQLGAACEAVASEMGADVAELGPKVGAWFAEWTANGWVSRVTL